MSRTVVVALALAVAGCAAAPRVDYHALSDTPRTDAAVTYALTDSIIVIGANGPPAPPASHESVVPVDLTAKSAVCTAGGCEPGLSAVATPTDFTGEYLAIVPRSRHFVSTVLSPTYVDNSLRLKTLTIEVKDHRVQVINAFGAVASGLIGIASGRAVGGENQVKVAAAPIQAPIALPIVIDLAAARKALKAPLPGNPDWKYTARFAVNDDPEKSGFLPRARRVEVHGALLTSICRRLKVELAHYTPKANANSAAVADGLTIKLDVTVADPEFLMTVPLPVKGAVTPHALCGADVQPQPVTEIGVDDIANAFAKQVQAIRAAAQ